MDKSGPAFPSYRYDGTKDVWHYGMSLRQWYAGMALSTMDITKGNSKEMAVCAYEIADAMIAEGNKT